MMWWDFLIYAFAGIGVLGILPELLYWLIALIFSKVF